MAYINKTLSFTNNSQLSSTDDARLSRIEAALPAKVAGRVTFSSSSLSVPGSTSVQPSGNIAPTGVTATGSTFAFVVQGNFGFISTGTSITIYWDGTNQSKLMTIRRADGSSYPIPGGSLTISGLTKGVSYSFAPFVSVAQPATLSFVQGDSGTPQFAFSPSATPVMLASASQTQRLTTNESVTQGMITFTSSVGGSGIGTGTYTGQA
jgi:hypothetical protein